MKISILICLFAIISYILINLKSKVSPDEKKCLKWVIKEYERVISEVKDKENWLFFISENGMGNGVCHFLRNHPIWGYQTWITLIPRTIGGYWYRTPYLSSTKEAAIEALQFRVDKMKELVK